MPVKKSSKTRFISRRSSGNDAMSSVQCAGRWLRDNGSSDLLLLAMRHSSSRVDHNPVFGRRYHSARPCSLTAVNFANLAARAAPSGAVQLPHCGFPCLSKRTSRQMVTHTAADQTLGSGGCRADNLTVVNAGGIIIPILPSVVVI
jgi:hypothetical protein